MSPEPGQLLDDFLDMPPDRRRASLGQTEEDASVVRSLIGALQALVIDDLGRALDASEMIVELADAVGAPGVRTHARRARAHALAYANRLDEASAVLAEALHLAEGQGDRAAEGEVRMAMLHVLNRLGRSDDAVEAGERRALAALREVDEPVLTAKAEANLGVVYRTRNDPLTALRLFDSARATLAENPVAAAQIDSNRAEALLELNRFAESESAFDHALEAFEQAGMTRARAIVEGNLADLMSRQGRMEGALRRFEHARRLMDDAESPGDVARLQSEEAEAMLTAGLTVEAADALASAVDALDACKLAWESARARTSLAQALIELRRYDEAEATLAAARSAFETLGHDHWAGRVDLLEGRLALIRHRHEHAERALDRALDRLGDRPLDAAVTRMEHARLALDRGEPERAAILVAAAMETAAQLDLAPLLTDLLALRAGVHAALGQSAAAVDDLRQAVRHLERLRGSLQADRLRTAFARRRADVHRSLVELLLESDRPEDVDESFATVERSKGRTLLDLVSGAVEPSSLTGEESADPVEAAIGAEVGELRAELNGLYSRLHDPGGLSVQPEELAVWAGQIDRCERRLQRAERRLGATRVARSVFAPSLDRAAVTSILAPDSALVEYFMTGTRIHAFVLTPDSTRRVVDLARAGDVAEHLERFRFQVNRIAAYDPGESDARGRLADDARRELRSLHDCLMAPLAPAIGAAAHLHVVPSGILHRVPFHALWDGDRYVIDRHRVTCTPSASLLEARGRPEAADASLRPLLVGQSDDIAPRIDAEIRRVGELLPDAVVLDGADATVQSVMAEAPRAGLLHFACHGRFDPEHPLSSGLRLSDGWLTLRDLYRLRLPGSIVVLSGCDTGVVNVVAGDELAGLAHGFFAAGAGALLMSLWPLHDDSAERLMSLLYARLNAVGRLDACVVADALRTAQIELREERPHPAFWAPLTFQGRAFSP